MITTHKVLSASEEDSLRRVLTRTLEIDRDRRNALMFTILLETGCRVGELLLLRVKDLNPETETLFITALKGSNDRELPIKSKLAKALRKHLMLRFNKEFFRDIDPNERIFDITYERVYQLWAFYTPNSKKVIHSLRHTFAVGFYSKSKDLKALQMALGHRNIINTMVYLDFFYSQDALRKIMLA
jgi:integrase/recombinase XerC